MPRAPLLINTRPEISGFRKPVMHRSQGERLRLGLAPLDFLPRAGRRDGRTGLGADRVGSSKRGTVPIAIGVDQDALAAIRLAELLRQVVRMPLHDDAADTMGESRNVVKIGLPIQGHPHVKALRSGRLDPA